MRERAIDARPPSQMYPKRLCRCPALKVNGLDGHSHFLNEAQRLTHHTIIRSLTRYEVLFTAAFHDLYCFQHGTHGEVCAAVSLGCGEGRAGDARVGEFETHMFNR